MAEQLELATHGMISVLFRQGDTPNAVFKKLISDHWTLDTEPDDTTLKNIIASIWSEMD